MDRQEINFIVDGKCKYEILWQAGYVGSWTSSGPWDLVSCSLSVTVSFVDTPFGTIAPGSFTGIVRSVSQPAASVTCTVHKPAHRPLTDAVPWPAPGSGVHTKLYGATPPEVARTMVPSQVPPHVASVTVGTASMPDGVVITNCTVVSQPNASVTVSVYAPEQSAVTLGVPSPLIGSGDQS